MTSEERYMREAMRLAKKAAALNEVPIGCVIVHDGKIIGRGYNRRTIDKNVLAHAEIIAIKKACRIIGDWRLEECIMYVTLEPCPMCAGAIINARIRTVYYGADDSKAGSCGSLINLFDVAYNHKPEIVKGLMKEQCSGILTDFFRDLRKKRKEQRKLQRLSQQENQQE